MNYMNMQQTVSHARVLLLTVTLSIFSVIPGISQKGLLLEEAMAIAESNSPAMMRTRLSLVRSQENLNAQNAALKSNF
ncbi:MAG: hypothetical protein MUP53_05700, partial [Bacteroidales bacterium]|nr:hypothetical protein [Bacteroidales bacterium]